MKKVTVYEYATTCGHLAGYYYNDADPDHPHPPDGDGWEMCGSAASPGMLYWFWRRKAAR